MERELQDTCQRLGLTNFSVTFHVGHMRPYQVHLHWGDGGMMRCVAGLGETVDLAIQDASGKMIAARDLDASLLKQVA